MNSTTRPRGVTRGLIQVAFLISLPIILLTTHEARAQGRTGTVIGTVVAREGRAPIADATVAVDGTSLTSVANGVGRFRVEGVPEGSRVLVVSANGYLQLRVSDIQIRANEATALVIELEITPNILERVQVTATKSELSIGNVAAQTDIVDRS